MTFTKTFRFSAAHYLDDYDGKCGHIHGHNYILEVHLTHRGNREMRDDMVIESAKLVDLLKPLMETLDHSLIIKKGGYLDAWYLRPNHDDAFWSNVLRLERNPTTEVLAQWIRNQVAQLLRDDIYTQSLRVAISLRETHTIEVTAV